MSNEVSYPEWQRIRSEMRKKEEIERGQDLGAPRPPIQVSITDQIVRAMIKDIRDLQEEIAALKRLTLGG